jgi:hypothetical protein
MEKYEFTMDADDMRAAMTQPVVFTHRGVCEYCRKPNQLLCNLGGSLVCLECRDGVVKQLKEQLLAPARHRRPGEEVLDYAMSPAPPVGVVEGVVVTYAPRTAAEARRVRDSRSLSGATRPYRLALPAPREA